ncbi:hypothetical protein JTE90_002972 [Oedothorax gibbosus]|uniref:Uncharacterized protein n=1 Tax=Oedothorax gibbosus TaxID=931172 RepID=A0AAV6VG64_9ARAC|nr:hypothetical protein JTE90_002972 [Oedothorax gibbosus]
MKELHQSPSTSAESIAAYTPDEALSLIVDLSLGKDDYLNLREGAKVRGANIYPPYNVIANAKKLCYPPNITITETAAQIPLQDLLDLTVKRLSQVQSEILLQHALGQLSEDVLEASHKIYKNVRLFHSRKTSRINTNTDIFNWMLISADLIISSYRKHTRKSSRPFSKETLDMLKIPDFLKDEPMDIGDDVMEENVTDD